MILLRSKGLQRFLPFIASFRLLKYSGEVSKWKRRETTTTRTSEKRPASKEDGTVFGIVSRAIRPRRRGCDRDYLRVCRQRRVEFGTSLALLVLVRVVVVVVVVALCALGNLVSSFVSFVSFSRHLSSETDSSVLVVVLVVALQVKPSPKPAKKH